MKRCCYFVVMRLVMAFFLKKTRKHLWVSNCGCTFAPAFEKATGCYRLVA